MKQKTRILAVLFAAALLFILLGSAQFVAAEENHDCTGRDCPVCVQLGICENILHSGSLLGLTVAAVAAGYHFLCGSVSGGTQDGQQRTLVTLKVKLSN